MERVLYFFLVLLFTIGWTLGGLWLTLIFEAPMSNVQTELCLAAVALGVLWWPYFLIEKHYAFYRDAIRLRLFDWDAGGVLTYSFCVVLCESPILLLWIIGEAMKNFHL